ncbi:hypothetical protein Tco_1029535 [Tanacetum coccineum]|uniref:Uncharacterized protein n=1 Tax=Tanacetum coccineum TaxID=301880 RepID=A0ABQ5G5A3_9ASTR
MNPLFSNSNHEQTYHEQPKIINFTTGDDQIISEIIFDDPNIEVNDGSVEHDKNAHDSYDNELEQLARNVYKEAEKQYILAKKDKQQNVELTKQLEQYKEMLNVSEQRNQLLELKTAHTSLKHKLNATEDKPKPLFVYDPQLKHGLGYENPYTLKKAISQNPKLYDASYIHSSKVHVNVCDTEEILKDATKSQIKIENTLKDPIDIEKKQNFRPIDYGKLNDLYKTFVPQVELSLEQKCFSSAFTSSETPTSASTSSSPSLTMPSSRKIIRHFHMLEDEIKKFDLDATMRQNEILNDRLLEATLKHDVESCVLMCFNSMNDNLNNEIEKVKRESINVQENLLKRIKILENNF